MPSKNASQCLRDILENIEGIQSFVAGMDFAMFVADRKTVCAVTRALEIVSEASRRLPDDLKQRHPGIDWIAVAAAGNVYRHEYGACGVYDSAARTNSATTVFLNATSSYCTVCHT
jgi:uncharacterized protein with HEPN domain